MRYVYLLCAIFILGNVPGKARASSGIGDKIRSSENQSKICMLYGGVKLLQHLFYRPWHRPLLQINRILAYGVYTWGAWKKTPLQAFIYKTIVELPQPFLENIPQKLKDECTTPLEHKTRLYPLQSVLCQTAGKLAAFLALLESNYCLGGHLRAYAYRELAHSFTTLACTQIPPESVHNRLAMACTAYIASLIW